MDWCGFLHNKNYSYFKHGFHPTVVYSYQQCCPYAGVESGLNGDDIIAWQLGASDYSKLTQTQQEYVDKIKAKLSEVSL